MSSNILNLFTKVYYHFFAECRGRRSRPKSEGANFDGEIYTTEYEAYNRYECYLWGSGGLPPENILETLREYFYYKINSIK